MTNLIQYLNAEHGIEQALCENPAFIAGLEAGKPRPGHPEGAVKHHVKEVLDNITDLVNELGGTEHPLTVREIKQLRFIAFVHDSFKHEVDRDRPRAGENHHAMKARRFAENFLTAYEKKVGQKEKQHVNDLREVLDIIELHDEAYNAWQLGQRKGRWQEAEARLEKLFKRLGNKVGLFSDFYEVDSLTGDKDISPLEWYWERKKEWGVV